MARNITSDISATGTLDVTGAITNSNNKTDGSVFIPIGGIEPIGGTWTPTRIAENNVVLRKTAAANTTYLHASLRPYFRTTSLKGIRITSIDVAYSIGTLALVAHTFAISSATYANNVAVALGAHGGVITGTLATATQANPYLTNLSLGSPAFINVANRDLRIEILVNAAATSAYDFYGLFVNYDYNNL